MAVANQDLHITRGDDEAYLLKFAQSVQGSTFFFTAKQSLTDDDTGAVLKEQTTPIGPDYLTALLTLPHGDTAGLAGRSYFYDIQWVQASGGVTTIMRGKLYVDLDVTQRTS